MSARLPKLDNILTEQQREQLPDRPQESSKLLQHPKKTEILDFGEQKTASTVAYGILTPLVEEDVLEGRKSLTDVDWNRLRSTAEIIHDGPIKSIYVGEEILEEFEEKNTGLTYIKGSNPGLAELRTRQELYDRLKPLERSHHIDSDNFFQSIDTALENNRVLCAYLTDPNGNLTDSRNIAYIQDKNEPYAVNQALGEVASTLANAKIENLVNNNGFRGTKVIGAGEDGGYWLHTEIQETHSEEPGDYQLSLDLVGYEGELEDLDLEIDGAEVKIYEEDKVVGEKNLGKDYEDKDFKVLDGLEYNNRIITSTLEEL